MAKSYGHGPKHTYGGGCENKAFPKAKGNMKNMSFSNSKGGTDPNMASRGGGQVQSVSGMSNYAGKSGLHGIGKYQ